MNIPALEAQETIRFCTAIGAVMDAKNGPLYMENLADVAYSDEPDMREKYKEMVAATAARDGATVIEKEKPTAEQWLSAMKQMQEEYKNGR